MMTEVIEAAKRKQVTDKSDKLLKDAFMRKNQQCNIRLISFNIIELLHI
jgi:hypothetical protein